MSFSYFVGLIALEESLRLWLLHFSFNSTYYIRCGLILFAVLYSGHGKKVIAMNQYVKKKKIFETTFMT